VKSDGEFEDILAADNPDVWVSHRPAEGGEAGAMLAKIIERAAALKAGRQTTDTAKKTAAPKAPAPKKAAAAVKSSKRTAAAPAAKAPRKTTKASPTPRKASAKARA
jgi:hypothetical protein